MAEEETKTDEGLQTDEGNTGNEGADSQAGGKPSEDDAGDKVDYEKRYKDLQAEQTRTSQENADLRGRVEQLEQPAETPAPEDDDLDDEGFVDGKTVSKMINQAVSQAVSKVRMETANTYFRKTYPDLVKHENVIAGIMRNPTSSPKKGASAEERIDAAVKEFNALTEEAQTEAKEKAEKEAKEREEANRKASGLTSSSTTTPKGGEEELSDEQELANRKTQSAKRRGLA